MYIWGHYIIRRSVISAICHRTHFFRYHLNDGQTKFYEMLIEDAYKKV